MVKYNVLESFRWCTATWKGTSLPIMQSLISQHSSQRGYAPGNIVGMVTAGSMTFFFPCQQSYEFLFTSGSSKFRLIALLFWGKKEKRAHFIKQPILYEREAETQLRFENKATTTTQKPPQQKTSNQTNQQTKAGGKAIYT